MRRRCAVPPDATVLAVTRAEQAICDRAGLADRFTAALAGARARFPVDVHGAALFADHWRAVVTARDGYLLAGFLRQVTRRTARAVIALGLDGWAAPIWHRRTELTVLRDDAAAGRALHDLIGRVATCVPIASVVDDRALAPRSAPFEQPPTLLLVTEPP
jgi:hypothetical protein